MIVARLTSVNVDWWAKCTLAEIYNNQLSITRGVQKVLQFDMWDWKTFQILYTNKMYVSPKHDCISEFHMQLCMANYSDKKFSPTNYALARVHPLWTNRQSGPYDVTVTYDVIEH